MQRPLPDRRSIIRCPASLDRRRGTSSSLRGPFPGPPRGPRLGQMDRSKRGSVAPAMTPSTNSLWPPPPRSTNPPSHLASVLLLPTASTSVDVPSTFTPSCPRQRSPGSFLFRHVSVRLLSRPVFRTFRQGPAHLSTRGPLLWTHGVGEPYFWEETFVVSRGCR